MFQKLKKLYQFTTKPQKILDDLGCDGKDGWGYKKEVCYED